MRVPAPALCVLSLLLAGCSTLGEFDSSAPPEATVTTVESATSTTATSVPEALAFDDRPGTDPATTTTTTADDGATATSTPAGGSGSGSGGATAVTRPAGNDPVTIGGPPATVDPSTLYVGVVGALGFDEPVVDGTASVARPPGAPLTGIGVDPGRRAVVVKIDNSGPARPQAGIDTADLVIEEEVEWGLTRLAAVFHSDGGVVGPVRSGRTTDLAVLTGLGGPGFVYSGANDVTDAVLRSDPTVVNLSAARTGGYWRQSGRRAPHNLFIDLADVWDALPAGNAQPFFAIGTTPGGIGTVAGSATITYPNNRVHWVWTDGRWARQQGGAPHRTDTGTQLAVDNVVVIETRRVATGLHDSSGGVVPEFVFVGTGEATVYLDGRRLDATWIRPTLRSPVALELADGTPVALRPGQTWVQLVDGATDWGS